MDSAEGRLDLWAPQVRGSEERFSSPLLAFLRGRTAVLERLVTEMYAHGLSTRDIEAAFTDATGGCILSKSMVSEVTARLWQEYQAFRARRLDDLAVAYLFADGLYEPLRRTGQTTEAAENSSRNPLCTIISVASTLSVHSALIDSRGPLATWRASVLAGQRRGSRPCAAHARNGHTAKDFSSSQCR